MTYERIGQSSMRFDDPFGDEMRRVTRASAIAAAKGAEAAKEQLLSIFRSRGGSSPWAGNAPSTIERKGSTKPLFDTGSLVEGIEIRPKEIGSGENSAKVGWFDTPHPNSGLTMAGLAAVHDGLSAIGGGYYEAPNGAMVPHRPHISQVAYNPSMNQEVLTKMELSFRTAHGSTYTPRRGRTAADIGIPEGFFDGGGI